MIFYEKRKKIRKYIQQLKESDGYRDNIVTSTVAMSLNGVTVIKWNWNFNSGITQLIKKSWDMWNIDPIQILQYYEKQVTLRGGH
jgi:hypothetical protein